MVFSPQVQNNGPMIYPDPSTPGFDGLRQVFDPRSIAIVGASNDKQKWGYWLTAGALRGAHRRTVRLVNPSGAPVCGQPTYRRLEELPEVPQLVATAVPLASFEAVVNSALELGAQAILAINAGFAESGAAGRRRQEELAERVRAKGAVMIGPNCLGIVDTSTELQLAWTQAGPAGLPSGPIAVVSQSGNVGLEIALTLRERGVGVSRFVSVGNQADLGVADFVGALIGHEATRVVVIYVEEFRHARDVLRAITAAREVGKDVVLLAPAGATAARAAQSHTGALATDAHIVQAACRDSGAIQTHSLAETVDLAEFLARSVPPRGRRIAVVSDGGGHAVLAADALDAVGLEVAPFSHTLQEALQSALDPSSTTTNPVDIAAANTRLEGIERAVNTILDTAEIDGIVVTGGLGAFAAFDPALEAAETESAVRMATCAAERQLPLIVHSMFAETPVLKAMNRAGALVYSDLQRGARALARAEASVVCPRVSFAPIPPAESTPIEDGYFAARTMLAEAGLVFPRAVEVTHAEAAVEAAEAVGWPVALKAVDLLHKSDTGGVALGLRDPSRLRAEFSAMSARTGSGRFSVEAMASHPDGIEMLIGARRDPTFGPLIVLGMGGLYAEVLNDTQITLAPAPVEHIIRLIGQLHAAPILVGTRGRPPLDVESLAHAAYLLAHVLMTNPAITDIEVNPLLVLPSGVIALDARVLSEVP